MRVSMWVNDRLVRGTMNKYEGIHGCIVKHYVCTAHKGKILVHDTRRGTVREFCVVDVDCMCARGDCLFYFVWPNTAQMRDVETGAIVKEWEYSDYYGQETMPDIEQCISSPGRHVAGISSHKSVYVCHVDSSETTTLHHDQIVTDASFHPTQDELVVSHHDGLRIWCTNTWTATHSVSTDIHFISLAHSPCGKYLAIGSPEHVRVWSTTDYTEEKVFSTDSTTVGLTFSPCSTFLLTGDADLECCEWNWREARLLIKTCIPIQNIERYRLLGSYINSCAYVGDIGAIVTSLENSFTIPLTFNGHRTNANYAYILELLDKQQWWPSVISKVILSYLTITFKL